MPPSQEQGKTWILSKILCPASSSGEKVAGILSGGEKETGSPRVSESLLSQGGGLLLRGSETQLGTGTSEIWPHHKLCNMEQKDQAQVSSSNPVATVG